VGAFITLYWSYGGRMFRLYEGIHGRGYGRGLPGIDRYRDRYKRGIDREGLPGIDRYRRGPQSVWSV